MNSQIKTHLVVQIGTHLLHLLVQGLTVFFASWYKTFNLFPFGITAKTN